MTIETVRDLALTLPGVTEDFPFDDSTLAFRVGGKIFVLIGVDRIPPAFNAKCDPERAIELRGEWTGVLPGYHMNKKHWNTVLLDGSVPASLVEELVRHAWELVYRALPRRERDAIALD